jgi:hypothetical protein
LAHRRETALKGTPAPGIPGTLPQGAGHLFLLHALFRSGFRGDAVLPVVPEKGFEILGDSGFQREVSGLRMGRAEVLVELLSMVRQEGGASPGGWEAQAERLSDWKEEPS